MSSRPTVTVISPDGKPSKDTHPYPQVFLAPIRPDIVQYENPIMKSEGKN